MTNQATINIYGDFRLSVVESGQQQEADVERGRIPLPHSPVEAEESSLSSKVFTYAPWAGLGLMSLYLWKGQAGLSAPFIGSALFAAREPILQGTQRLLEALWSRRDKIASLAQLPLELTGNTTEMVGGLIEAGGKFIEATGKTVQAGGQWVRQVSQNHPVLAGALVNASIYSLYRKFAS